MEALAAVARSGAPRPIVPTGLRPEPAPSQPALAHPGTPFVGRAVEFGVLLDGYRAALSGEAGCVALLGDAGIVKTRLADEFIIWS